MTSPLALEAARPGGHVIVLRVTDRAFRQGDAIMHHLARAYGIRPAGTELARLLPDLRCDFNHQVIAILATRVCGYAALARASQLHLNITRVETALRARLASLPDSGDARRLY